MKTAWDFLSGKKTYILAGLGALLMIAHKAGLVIPGVSIDDASITQNLYVLAMAVAVRHGLSTEK